MPTEKFGRLTVDGEPFKINDKRFWRCVCDCGNIHVARLDHVRSGKTKSCGCWHDEAARINNSKHGHHPRGTATPEYRAWCNMNDRCYRISNVMFKNYGGRGIRVCDEWRTDFVRFLTDVGFRPSPEMSIDRIDVDGDYAPSNVRWADPKTQARNVRVKKLIHAFGLSLTLAEWADKSGIRKGTIWQRINVQGWTPERAVTL